MKTKTLIGISAVAIVAVMLAYPTLDWILIDCRDIFWIDRWIYLIDSRCTTFLALALGFGWLVSEMVSKSRWLRIVLGVASLACLLASFRAVSGRQQGEITIRQISLHDIANHLDSGDIPEVLRAIRIHDEDLAATKDSWQAAQSLNHELNRGCD